MTGRIKNLGIALLAALALVAVQAAAASAEPLFHSESEHTIGLSSQEGSITFTTDPGTIHCSSVTGTGTLVGKTTAEVTGTPSFSGCVLTTIFGNISLTFNTKGCINKITADYEAHLICPHTPTSGPNPTVQHGPVTVTGPGCTVTIPAQSATNVQYTNVGTGKTREVIAHESGTGITYSYSGFTCGNGANTKNGTAKGTVRTTGQNTAGEHVGIWWTDE